MTALLALYSRATWIAAPLLKAILHARLGRGKEDAARMGERTGRITAQRPQGRLVWIHAASVGEAQSALILIDAIGKTYPGTHVLVTTGTVTSATLMQSRLPSFAFHQYVPLDHPRWVARFLNHWAPDVALWMESELWPNMLTALKKRNIPAALINARLSDSSFSKWQWVKKDAMNLLSCFSIFLAQTKDDAERFEQLGQKNIFVTGNLKFSAAPLPYDELALATLKLATSTRKLWVYASTHEGEESLACRVHKNLKETYPDLLTIIVPRHPQRRADVANTCFENAVKYRLRSDNTALPSPDDDIYIADTMGELGLFYTLCPIAMIGRSFSDDGGGGHNPIEAAQLGCAVITGPNNQFQRPIYDEMQNAAAVAEVQSEAELQTVLDTLLSDEQALISLRGRALAFSMEKEHIMEDVMARLCPFLSRLEQKNAA